MRHHRRVGLTAVALAALAFLYVPIIVVFVNAFNGNVTMSSWGGVTIKWFGQAMHDPGVQTSFIASLKIGAASTVISVVIAISAALYWRGAGSVSRRLLESTTYMRIALPEVVSAVALFLLFRWLNVSLGIWTVIIGHVVFNSAYASIVIQARISTLGNRLELAAADLGARPSRVFLRVTLPLLLPAVVVASLLVFTLSFDDVVTSTFLAGSGTQTLPMDIMGLVRFSVTPKVNAIGAGVMTITFLTISLAFAAVAISDISFGKFMHRGRPVVPAPSEET